MVFKYCLLAALVAIARAGEPLEYDAHYASSLGYQDFGQDYGYAEPTIAKYATPIVAKVAQPVYAKAVYAEPTSPPHYEYGYSVSDPHTGDVKTQHETRKGDAVHGSYSLIDADGTKRTVEYTADAHHGFNAVVHKEPAHVKTVAPVAKYATPVALAAPVAKISEPYGYSHGLTKYASAPVYPSYSHSVPSYPSYAHAGSSYYH